MGSKDFKEAFEYFYKKFSKWYSATPVIDSFAFKLHYPFTFSILLFAAGGVLINNYAASPIKCHSANRSGLIIYHFRDPLLIIIIIISTGPSGWPRTR